MFVLNRKSFGCMDKSRCAGVNIPAIVGGLVVVLLRGIGAGQALPVTNLNGLVSRSSPSDILCS